MPGNPIQEYGALEFNRGFNLGFIKGVSFTVIVASLIIVVKK